MKAYQLFPRPLRTLQFSAGNPDTINLGEQLPLTVFGRIAHLVALEFRVNFSSLTYSSAPTIVQLNNVVANMTFRDGFNTRFSGGGFNLLRVLEMLENGKLQIPDPTDNQASTTAFTFARMLEMGPAGFEGNPTDFMLCNAALRNATIDLTYGSLAAISASAATCTIQPVAWLAALDKEIRVPPYVERSIWPLGSKKGVIQGRALYTALGLLNSTAFDPIAAGAYAALALLTGAGDVSPVEASTLEKAFHYFMKSGQLTQVHGEPLNTQDANARAMNPATPTALQAADSIVQPLVWSPQDSRISKLLYGGDGTIAVDWTGTASSAPAVGTRIVAQPREAAAAMAARAVDVLGVQIASMNVKSLSKQPYIGPRVDFFPWQANLA